MSTSLSDLTIAVLPEADGAIVRTIFDGLSRSNAERTGDGNLERLCIVARETNDAVVGGVYGEIYWGWLNILALWVAPAFRRRGIGSQLLSRAEAEAVAKGCRGAYLDTFSFQEHDLYSQAGYEVFGTLEQFPGEHSRQFLRKRLHAA